MIQKPDAILVHHYALKAIMNLTTILNGMNNPEFPAEYEEIKKAVAKSMGQIQTGILDLIGQDYPELVDLE